ncbi:polyamine aminopropyltransferase [bacterium]|nr:polyamine aminopropyltransferase [bacterium]
MRAPLALLYLNVLIIATCGLVYELLAGTLASYVLGDSVTQFSLIIGVYLSALGVGAWLSSFVKHNLARVFIEVELGVALLGGGSTPLLFLSFARLMWFHPVLYGVVFMIGVLVGLELPLLMRILKDHLDFEELVSRVLAFDYLGALMASLLFPLFLVPTLGLVRTSLVFGMLNATVGLWGTSLLRPILSGPVTGLRLRAAVVLTLLTAGILKADRLTTLAEDQLFGQAIVYTKTTLYQRIVVTQSHRGFQLHLNGNLQFDSFDEYRYHEALVHPPLAAAQSRNHVLILGGGDGLALREVLCYDDVVTVTLVDIDPGMTSLAAGFAPLRELSRSSLSDPRVTVINDDAMIWLDGCEQTFDAVLIDFPDPNSFALGKLYTVRFFQLLKRCLKEHAVLGIQSTSPLLARQSYWCVIRTLEASGFQVLPYHVSVPSFGEWGFALGGLRHINPPQYLPESPAKHVRFLNREALRDLFHLPADMQPTEVEVNRLNNQSLVRYYEQESALAAGR